MIPAATQPDVYGAGKGRSQHNCRGIQRNLMRWVLANWLSRSRRARVRAALTTWFDPQRWSPNDAIIAVSALVLVVSLFVPWFEASVRIRDSSVSGFLIDPKGTVSGIAVHAYLWVVFGVALLQFAVLAARYAPGRNGFTLPRYRQFLVATSALSCVAVAVAFAMRPTTWTGGNYLGGGFYIVVTWSYGAVVALAAAVVSLAIAASTIRDQRVH